jgi:hypothetical protein
MVWFREAEHIYLYLTYCVLLFGKAGGCGSNQHVVKPTASNIEARSQGALSVLRCLGLGVLVPSALLQWAIALMTCIAQDLIVDIYGCQFDLCLSLVVSKSSVLGCVGMCCCMLVSVLAVQKLQRSRRIPRCCVKLVSLGLQGPVVCWQEKAKSAYHAGGCMLFMPLLLCRSGILMWQGLFMLLGLQVNVCT